MRMPRPGNTMPGTGANLTRPAPWTWLRKVEMRPSPLSSTRMIVEVYTNRNTDFTEKFNVRVDVTEEFPFLVTRMSAYFDREIGSAR
jgi:hypothetical protein